jgi:hypothetical protein
MAISENPVLAYLNRLRARKRNQARPLEEEQVIPQITHGLRASLLMQKQDLNDLIVTCISWDTVIRDLPRIPKRRKDQCWAFCADLTSEVQGLRIELLKLKQDVVALELRENELAVLEEVVRYAHREIVGIPNFDRVLADKRLLARSKIRFWHCSRVGKHAQTLEVAAQHFQAARDRVQSFRMSLAADHGRVEMTIEHAVDGAKGRARSSRVIRPARMAREDGKGRRPWLLHRISTSWSSLSGSAMLAAHPPAVDL